jgi:hypothetical protein
LQHIGNYLYSLKRKEYMEHVRSVRNKIALKFRFLNVVSSTTKRTTIFELPVEVNERLAAVYMILHRYNFTQYQSHQTSFHCWQVLEKIMQHYGELKDSKFCVKDIEVDAAQLNSCIDDHCRQRIDDRSLSVFPFRFTTLDVGKQIEAKVGQFFICLYVTIAKN